MLSRYRGTPGLGRWPTCHLLLTTPSTRIASPRSTRASPQGLCTALGEPAMLLLGEMRKGTDPCAAFALPIRGDLHGNLDYTSVTVTDLKIMKAWNMRTSLPNCDDDVCGVCLDHSSHGSSGRMCSYGALPLYGCRLSRFAWLKTTCAKVCDDATQEPEVLESKLRQARGDLTEGHLSCSG